MDELILRSQLKLLFELGLVDTESGWDCRGYEVQANAEGYHANWGYVYYSIVEVEKKVK